MDTTEIKAKIKSVYELTRDTVYNLNIRWLDEREYEDFAEYSKVLKARLEKVANDVVFVKATKRPFGFVFEYAGLDFQVYAKVDCAGIKCVGNHKK